MRGRLLLLLAGLLVGLLLAEVAMRLVGFGPPPAPRRVVYDGQSKDWCCGPRFEVDGVHRYTARTTWKHCYSGVTGADMDAEGCVQYRINAHGYRGPNFTRTKPPDAFRIVLLGDSFTFGEGTPEPLIYPSLLGKAFSTQRIDGRRVEVINLGIPGNDLEESRLTHRSIGRALAPDHVVLQWNTNDFPSRNVHEDHLRLIGVAYQQLYARAQALRWSHLLSFGFMRLQMWALSRDLIRTSRQDEEAGSDPFEEIGRMKRMAEQDGAGFTVLAFPELIRFDDYPYATILERLDAYCRQEKIALIDLLPALSAHQDSELWVHETDHHPNRVAHTIAARELLRGIEGSQAETGVAGR